MDSFKLNEDTGIISEKLQTVYDTIKKERPWDIRPVDKMYTTAKEKYMTELIKEGKNISDEHIVHVVGRCYKYHEFHDGKYVCWFGFILTRKEFPYDHFECQSFHNLNHRLTCYKGRLFYPVDILSNPFGEWQPDETKGKPEIHEVYNMIKGKWPERWYEDELHKYTLKNMIQMIENGEPLTADMKKHVVDGCDRDCHSLDGNYLCFSGFLRRSLPLVKDNDCFVCHGSVLSYVMNPNFFDQTGIRDIPVTELRFRKYQTDQKVASEIIGPCMKDARNIYDRILHRDLISPKFADKIQLTWQEQYLIDNVIPCEDIPNEVISHVLDGCYTLGHMLTENYACCRGYILKQNTFSFHDFRECLSHHEINQDLNCYEGRIYHRCAEEPKGVFKLKTNDMLRPGLIKCWSHRNPKQRPMAYASSAKCTGNNRINRNFAPYIRLRPRPAPPPLDHLDNPPVQEPIAAARQQNVVAVNVRQNDNDGVEMAILRNVAPNPNRHPNPAPPPPYIDI